MMMRSLLEVPFRSDDAGGQSNELPILPGHYEIKAWVGPKGPAPSV